MKRQTTKQRASRSIVAGLGLCLILLAFAAGAESSATPSAWEPVGLSGGGGLFAPAISAADHDLMMVNCDMSAAYISEDGGRTWRLLGRQGPQTFGGYFHPERDGWIYMTLTEGAPGAGLWLSRDGGRTWRAFDDLPFANIQRVTLDPSDRARMYVTTFGGSVWRGPVAPAGK